MDALAAARRRLALASLLHERLGSDAPVASALRDMEVLRQGAELVVGVPPLFFVHSHPEILCGSTADVSWDTSTTHDGAEDLATAEHTKGESGGTAVASAHVMSRGTHYSEVHMLHGAYAAVGLARPGWDPADGERWASATAQGFSVKLWTGSIQHNGQQHGSPVRAREGDVVALQLSFDESTGHGRLSAWKDGAALGVICDGLDGEWCWAATLTGGCRVGIRSLSAESIGERQALQRTLAAARAAAAQAAADREKQQALGEADEPMLTGTRVYVGGKGVGIVFGFQRSRLGPNVHRISFAGAETYVFTFKLTLSY